MSRKLVVLSSLVAAVIGLVVDTSEAEAGRCCRRTRCCRSRCGGYQGCNTGYGGWAVNQCNTGCNVAVAAPCNAGACQVQACSFQGGPMPAGHNQPHYNNQPGAATPAPPPPSEPPAPGAAPAAAPQPGT